MCSPFLDRTQHNHGRTLLEVSSIDRYILGIRSNHWNVLSIVYRTFSIAFKSIT